MKSLKSVYKPRPSVFDKARRDVVLDLSDLAENKIDPKAFFNENFITKGMEQLYTAVFKRLEGKTDDGIFKLTQSMGGGKTHNMINIGLLAQNPEFRNEVMGHVYKTTFTKKARVLSFSGRENPKFGIWGYLAEQAGKQEVFSELYAPLKAPGQSEWIKFLKDEPTIILLDELAPYFQNASTQAHGSGTLADITTSALSSLLVAINKEELKHVALVISDLSASYSKGSTAIAESFQDFEKETRRSATNFTPVQQNSDELYHILRKRLFENEADESDIKKVAEAYSKELDNARRMDLTNETPEILRNEILSSYPFHPSIRDLYARFKENPGFQQTRGLIRLMRTVVSCMWDKNDGWAEKTYLIHPFDVNPNDPDTLAELSAINDTLTNAISNDIASGGHAAAERVANELGNELPTRVSRLLLMASLSIVQGGIKGLKSNEIARNLACPGIDLGTLNAKILPELREKSWYLHADNTGNFLYKNVQNVSAMINTYKQNYPNESVKKEIVKLLEVMFSPKIKDCYQKVYVLPAIDQIDLDTKNVSLIIYQPNLSGGLHPDLKSLFEHSERLQNRILFLTGDHLSMDSILEQARGIKASMAVIDKFSKDKVATNDPQFEEANSQLENYQFKFRSAVTNIFVKLFYPTKMGLLDASIQLKFDSNNYNGEEQITKTLLDKRKFTTDITSEVFVKQIEAKLFAGQSKLPWSDLLNNAASMTDWIWHKPDALEQIKLLQVQKEHWRPEGNWINKGPFAKPPTSVFVQQIGRNDDTGEAELRIKALNGDTIHYQYGKGVNTNCEIWDTHETLKTKDMEVEFLCVDSKSEHKTGNSYLWQNQITLKYKLIPQGNENLLEIRVAPKSADIKYTTDGSEPLERGGIYEGSFAVQAEMPIQMVGIKGEYFSDIIYYKIPKEPTKFEIDKVKPLTWRRKISKDETSDSYQLIELLKKLDVKVNVSEIGSSGEEWVAMNISPNLVYNAGEIETLMKYIQDNLYSDGKIGIKISKSIYPNGQVFLDYIKETSEDYRADEIEQ